MPRFPESDALVLDSPPSRPISQLLTCESERQVLAYQDLEDGCGVPAGP
jgi:hypothetical protein